MIEVKGLVKRYSDKMAVDDISFIVNEGEILGFLGPNGAGKSTTMNIITGYISSTKGTVEIDGYEILRAPIKARSKIGYLPEQPPLYIDMTVKGYLDFVYRLKKVKKNKKEHIENICEMVGISEVYNRTIKKLSKGYKQRIGIAQALIGDPPVIILDEPTVGLDPKQIIGIRNLIKSLAEKHTVIFSSHILSEIQAVCNRVIVINNGKIVADSSAETILEDSSGEHRISLQIEGPLESIRKALEEVDGVVDVKVNAEDEKGVSEYIVGYNGQKDIRRDISRTMAKNDYPILEMKQCNKSLEDVFLRLTEIDDNEGVPHNEIENVDTDNALEEISKENNETGGDDV